MNTYFNLFYLFVLFLPNIAFADNSFLSDECMQQASNTKIEQNQINYPNTISNLLCLAIDYREKGDYEEAVELFQQILLFIENNHKYIPYQFQQLHKALVKSYLGGLFTLVGSQQSLDSEICFSEISKDIKLLNLKVSQQCLEQALEDAQFIKHKQKKLYLLAHIYNNLGSLFFIHKECNNHLASQSSSVFYYEKSLKYIESTHYDKLHFLILTNVYRLKKDTSTLEKAISLLLTQKSYKINKIKSSSIFDLMDIALSQVDSKKIDVEKLHSLILKLMDTYQNDYRVLANLYGYLGKVYILNGRLEEAVIIITKRALFYLNNNYQSDSYYWNRQLAVAYRKLGDKYIELQETDKAKQNFKKSLDFYELSVLDSEIIYKYQTQLRIKKECTEVSKFPQQESNIVGKQESNITEKQEVRYVANKYFQLKKELIDEIKLLMIDMVKYNQGMINHNQNGLLSLVIYASEIINQVKMESFYLLKSCSTSGEGYDKKRVFNYLDNFFSTYKKADTAIFYPIIANVDSTEIEVSYILLISYVDGRIRIQPYRINLNKEDDLNKIEDDLDKIVEIYKDETSKETTQGDYFEFSTRLYDLLIEPLNLEKIKTLVLVPNEHLTGMPFASLWDKGRKKFLFERFFLVVFPSLTSLNQSLRENEKNNTFLLTGLSEVAPEKIGVTALPNAEEEVKSIESTLKEQKNYSIKLLGKKFTVNELNTQINQKFDVVHIASHGKFREKATESYISTYDNDLTVQGLYQLLSKHQKTIDLLTLSACETAIGKTNIDNTAALGLAGIAFVSGVNSVLASLWEVPDKSTKDLMVEFYNNLMKGQTKVQALTNAQQVMYKDQDNDYRHPSSWAGFILVGDWK